MAASDLALPAADLALIEDAAREAGEIAMSFFRADNKVWHKHGNSPVSEADFAVDRFLTETLRSARPDYGWLSEETEDSGERLSASRIFVVDPIDGTRGFIDGRREWCISVAVVENGVPVAGVLECPALSETFAAASGEGSRLNGRPLERLSGIGVLSVTASRKLNDAIDPLEEDLDVAGCAIGLLRGFLTAQLGDGVRKPGQQHQRRNRPRE